MIIWGNTGNKTGSWTSLGSIATGNVHAFTRYRTGADGASLHPFQRTGQVSASSHALTGGRMTAAGPHGIGSAANAPAAYTPMRNPPVVPIIGGSRDPSMRV